MNRRFGLQKKIVLIVILASMLITVAISLIYYDKSVDSIRDNYENSVKIGIQMCADTFDDTMRDAYFACTYAASDDEVRSLMDSEKVDKELIRVLKSYRNQSKSIYSIYCCLARSDEILKIEADGYQIKDRTEEMDAWMRSIAEQTPRNSFSPICNTDTSSVIQHNFFTYTKPVFNDDEEEVGRLFVNVDEREVYFKCLQREEKQSSRCFIAKDQMIVSATDTSLLGTMQEQQQDMIVVKADMAMTDYQMISISDPTEITGDLKNTGNWLMIVAMLMNGLIAVPIIVAVRGVLDPMAKLEKTMNRVKEGDLSVRAEIYHQDEIGSLSENFNEMIQEIDNLIDALATEKLLKKEAEIEALQYQITPHFMYNTLASIRYAALMEHSDEIAGLLQAFVELLRLSASDRGAFITVQQEMKMVQNYIKLQEFRYANTFTASIDMTDETKQFYVPRLIVQPLVENAILHGLNHQEKNNHISIQVMKIEKSLVIKVHDNGCGMTQQEISNLLYGAKKSKFSGIGIGNIKERLRLYYGELGSLEYYSSEYYSSKTSGTSAVITLPATDNPDVYTI